MAIKLMTLAAYALLSVAVKRLPAKPAPLKLSPKEQEDEAIREEGRKLLAELAPDMVPGEAATFLTECESYTRRDLGYDTFYESFFLDVIRHRLKVRKDPDECWKKFCLC